MDILAKSPNDRVTVDYNGIEITFKPATTQESIDLESVVKSLQDASKSSMDKVQGMIEFIRTVVVDIRGIKRLDGSEWAPKIVDGKLSSASVEKIFGIGGENIVNILLASTQVFQSIPVVGQPVLHPQTGMPLKGVTVKKIQVGEEE